MTVVDLTHPAFTDLGGDFIDAEASARVEGHDAGRLIIGETGPYEPTAERRPILFQTASV